MLLGPAASQWVVTFSGPGTTPVGEAGAYGVGNIVKDGLYKLFTHGNHVHAYGQTALNNNTGFWAMFGAAHDITPPVSFVGDGTSEIFLDPYDVADRNNSFLADSSNLYAPPLYDLAMDSDLSGWYDGLDVARFNNNYLNDWVF